MNQKFEPMLAATLTGLCQLQEWPLRGSAKLDGLRCVVKDGVALSRNLKPFRNEFVQQFLGKKKYNGLDGELIVGEPYGGEVLNRTQSGVMSRSGVPDFTFHVFDDFSCPTRPFSYRIGHVEDRLEDLNSPRLALVPHEELHSAASFSAFEANAVRWGYEGVMLRHPDAPYKFGRSSPTEGWLWKVKRFSDGDAYVVSIEEGEHNLNPAEQDAMGRVKRSTHKANKVPSGKVGTILAKDADTGEMLRISPGRMTDPERALFFREPKRLLGKLIRYKWFDYGIKDAPRFNTFQAFRDVADRSPL